MFVNTRIRVAPQETVEQLNETIRARARARDDDVAFPSFAYSDNKRLEEVLREAEKRPFYKEEAARVLGEPTRSDYLPPGLDAIAWGAYFPGEHRVAMNRTMIEQRGGDYEATLVHEGYHAAGLGEIETRNATMQTMPRSEPMQRWY